MSRFSLFARSHVREKSQPRDTADKKREISIEARRRDYVIAALHVEESSMFEKESRSRVSEMQKVKNARSILTSHIGDLSSSFCIFFNNNRIITRLLMSNE